MKKSIIPILFVLLSVGHQVFGHDDHLHHWEIPSSDPDRIVLTLPGNPSTSFGVTWRTNTEIDGGVIEIAKETGAPRFDLTKRVLPAVTENITFGKNEWKDELSINYHSVTVDGLEPDTLYCYRVGDGDVYMTEWIQYRTAPADDSPITFLYFGDAQNSVFSHWSRVIRAAYQKAPHAHFALHAGDLINRANRDTEWAEWFKAGSFIHHSIATVPVAGNHEFYSNGSLINREKFLSEHWAPQFNLPVEDRFPEEIQESVYSIDFNHMRVIVLNSNKFQQEQVAWFREQLESNDKKWTVLSFHHPIFSSGKDRNNDDLRELWKPIIDEFGCDLILQGHDHTYARGQTPQVPVYSADSEGTESIQTVYVNSVSGPKQYEFQKNGWDDFAADNVNLIQKAENTQFFQVITIDGKKIDYKAYTAAGELYDSFVLKKDDTGSKTIIQGEAIANTRMFKNTEPYHREGMDY